MSKPSNCVGVTYSRARDGFVQRSSDVASALLDRLRSLVPDEAQMAEAIESEICKAFEAGVRQGKAEAQRDLSGVVRGHIDRALSGVAIEPARCPHCTGYECDVCGGTGKMQVAR